MMGKCPMFLKINTLGSDVLWRCTVVHSNLVKIFIYIYTYIYVCIFIFSEKKKRREKTVSGTEDSTSFW